MTTLSQTISKTANGISRTNRTDGRIVTGTKAKLHHGDSLVLEEGDGWGTATITKVTFYNTHDDCRNDANAVAYWKSAGDSSNLTGKFKVTATPDGKSVSLQDDEPEGSQDDLWYSVTIGTERVDPEVLNKGGGATPEDPTAWVD